MWLEVLNLFWLTLSYRQVDIASKTSDYDAITLFIILGEFGIVYKGYIMKQLLDQDVTEVVAIKTLKGMIVT